jgi:hypothetical protein
MMMSKRRKVHLNGSHRLTFSIELYYFFCNFYSSYYAGIYSSISDVFPCISPCLSIHAFSTSTNLSPHSPQISSQRSLLPTSVGGCLQAPSTHVTW